MEVPSSSQALVQEGQPAITADTSKSLEVYAESPEDYSAPYRPDLGTEGRVIRLRANHFQIDVPRIVIEHYSVHIVPEKCPKRINREIIQKLFDQCAFVDAHQPVVYDGRESMYSLRPLPFVSGKEESTFSVTLQGSYEGQGRSFQVKLSPLPQLNLGVLIDALNGSVSEVPTECMQALDVILRHLPNMTHTPVGRSFFSPPDINRNYLGGGREVWFGFHQSIKPTQHRVSLNIDQTVNDQRRPLNESQRLRLTKECKGLRIEVTHCGGIRRKYRICNITRKTAQTQTFPLKTTEGSTIDCSVAKYFNDRYSIKLKYPYLPCLQVGAEHKHTYLPPEVCRVVAGQRCIKKLSDMQTSTMIKATAKSAPDREREINALVHRTTFNTDPYVLGFGIHLNTQMTDVNGRILSTPKVQYGGRSKLQVTPVLGVWDMRGKQFHKISNDAGMPIVNPPLFCKYVPNAADHVEPLFRFGLEKNKDIQLILVILPGKTSVYAEVKRVGDTVLGLATQCVQIRNVNRTTPQTLSNLCLKINVKLGGINSILVPSVRPISVFCEPVIFIGADITHPPAGDRNKPSIAAIVGSMDGHPNSFYKIIQPRCVRIQQHRLEYIVELSKMVRDVLVKFYLSTGFKPVKIIMYRDGLTDNQARAVFARELMFIREACMSLESAYKPGITYVSVQKRHHTRLFCVDRQDQNGRSGNIPPGTTVDVTITHPNEFDFYLCSHAGIQGTSRPSYYHVLWDDNEFKSDDLQALTYQLCHTYVRCTRSVSIPAPAYYAHLVAFRARHHLVDRDHSEGSSSLFTDLGTSHVQSDTMESEYRGINSGVNGSELTSDRSNPLISDYIVNSLNQISISHHEEVSTEPLQTTPTQSPIIVHPNTRKVMYFA
ncbi:hypothetical protein ACOME3_007724 [Neoechinorhynchus agilis]